MQYCVTKEEVDWIVKDWFAQWKLPVKKLATREVKEQSSRDKDKAQSGSSARTNNLPDNTRMDTTQNHATDSSAILEQARRTTTTTRIGNQPQIKKRDTSQAGEERTQGTTSGAQPSYTIRNPTQEKEACKKRKYITKDLIITLI